jgi:hypothetical protein
MNPIFIININFQREYIDMKREILRRRTSDWIQKDAPSLLHFAFVSFSSHTNTLVNRYLLACDHRLL